MTDLCVVIIEGRLTKDVETKYTRAGSMVAKVSIASNESWKDRSTGEWKDDTCFITCEAWANQAETMAKYLHKGDGVRLFARLKQRRWEDAGVHHSVHFLKLDRFEFLPKVKKPEGTAAAPREVKPREQARPDPEAGSVFDDDLPPGLMDDDRPPVSAPPSEDFPDDIPF